MGPFTPTLTHSSNFTEWTLAEGTSSSSQAQKHSPGCGLTKSPGLVTLLSAGLCLASLQGHLTRHGFSGGQGCRVAQNVRVRSDPGLISFQGRLAVWPWATYLIEDLVSSSLSIYRVIGKMKWNTLHTHGKRLVTTDAAALHLIGQLQARAHSLRARF